MKVYLYELDSVRNSAAEIQVAQERLFEETVGNGNTVVLSANQLLDGMGFTGALYGRKGEENYQTILKLFQSGLVKVCKFTNPYTGEAVETLAKYWMNNMGKKHFIVSGIEISPERKADMKAVLTGEKNISILDVWDDTGTEKEKADAQYVQRVVNLIIELDYRVKNLWVEEEKGDVSAELSELLGSVIAKGITEPSLTAYQAVQKALHFLEEAEQELKEEDAKEADVHKKPSHYRSNWYKKLETHGDNTDVKTAKRIVDLCYNSAIESGIAGVSVEYETYQRTDESGHPLQEKEQHLLEASEIRLNQYQYLIREIEKYINQRGEEISLPPWGDALEVIRESKLEESEKPEDKTPLPPPRKDDRALQKQEEAWNKTFSKLFWKRIRHLAICAICLIVLGWLVSELETGVNFVKDLLQQNLAITSVKNVGLCVGSVLIILIIFLSYPLTYLFTYFCDWFAHTKIIHSEEDTVETLKRMVTLFRKRRRIKNYLKRIHTNDEKDADQP